MRTHDIRNDVIAADAKIPSKQVMSIGQCKIPSTTRHNENFSFFTPWDISPYLS